MLLVKKRHLHFNTSCPLWVKSRHLQCKTACPNLAIAAYDRADPDIRNSLDTLAVTITIVLEATRAAMDDAERRPETVAALAGNAIGWLKPLIARAGALINGESDERHASTPQDVVDRLMKR